MFKFDLGTKVRDKITGYEGTITARVEHLNGCVRYCIQGKAKDGKIPDGEWIDEQQLELIEEAKEDLRESTGGDRPNPKSLINPLFEKEDSF